MALRSVINSPLDAFRLFQKAMLCVAIALLTWTLLLIVKTYFEIPDSLIHLKEQMIENPNFISKIGEYNGYSIWFDKKLAAEKSVVPFAVSIRGKRDSLYVQITGTYISRRDGKMEFTKKDTVFSQ
jgi:hypothetical protein